MTSLERRELIHEILTSASEPISATALAGRFSVSRQVIVGDIALLRAEARRCGIVDIRQKAGDVMLAMSNLNFEGITAICADPDYKNRLFFVASAKVPTLRLKLHSSADSLKQTKALVNRMKLCFQV